MTPDEIRTIFGSRVDTVAAMCSLLEQMEKDPSVPANYRQAARLLVEATEIAWGPA